MRGSAGLLREEWNLTWCPRSERSYPWSIGIGIMNIILVSVTERTLEIGIRMAVGDRPGSIRLQFLAKSVIPCMIGGLVGVLAGGGLALGIVRLLGWPNLISADAALHSFGFAAAVGVFFGYYPAHKAASLDPIEALRYE